MTSLAAAARRTLADACGDTPSWICERVFDVTGGNESVTSLTDWFVEGPVTAMVVLIAAWILTRIARRAVARLVRSLAAPSSAATRNRLMALGRLPDVLGRTEESARAESRARSIGAVLGSSAAVFIWVVAGMIVLDQLGIAIGPLIAGAGIAGVALGFGAQSLVKDCLNGLFVLIEDQYGIGDVIDLGEAVGVVEEVSLRTTVLRGLDGTVWHVPNGEVKRVGNRSMLWSVAVVDVDVAYDSDLALARQVMYDTARELCSSDEWKDAIVDEPEVLGVEALAADGITMRMIVRTTPGSQWGLQRALREALKGAFDAADLEIPFPQRTVWHRNTPPD